MGQLASEALATVLTGRERESAQPFEWISGDLGQPRVDLDDKEAVRSILDGRA